MRPHRLERAQLAPSAHPNSPAAAPSRQSPARNQRRTPNVAHDRNRPRHDPRVPSEPMNSSSDRNRRCSSASVQRQQNGPSANTTRVPAQLRIMRNERPHPPAWLHVTAMVRSTRPGRRKQQIEALGLLLDPCNVTPASTRMCAGESTARFVQASRTEQLVFAAEPRTRGCQPPWGTGLTARMTQCRTAATSRTGRRTNTRQRRTNMFVMTGQPAARRETPLSPTSARSSQADPCISLGRPFSERLVNLLVMRMAVSTP